MPLLIPHGPSFEYCVDNLHTEAQASPTSNIGDAVTAGASNADGTAVTLLAALTHDVEYLHIAARGFSTGNTNNSALADILFDPAGGTSWQELIPDLLVGQGIATSTLVPVPYYYDFPIWVPAGSTIGARARNAAAGTVAGGIMVQAYGGNKNPGSWWCGKHVTAIGIDAANSQGQNHTAGNSNAYSTWANLGSVLPADCGALQFAVQGTNTDTTQSGGTYRFEFGYASQRVGPPIHRTTNTTEAGWIVPTGPIFKQIPAGTQLQVRGTAAGTAEIVDVAAYAVH
jgi:hypothetical protein